jgi:hypothetical protein
MSAWFRGANHDAIAQPVAAADDEVLVAKAAAVAAGVVPTRAMWRGPIQL